MNNRSRSVAIVAGRVRGKDVFSVPRAQTGDRLFVFKQITALVNFSSRLLSPSAFNYKFPKRIQ